MAPLILHNVPDDELYIGDDGVKRPYAMLFSQQEGAGIGRSRKSAHESGSFGKSTRRSRSKTGTPARREDPTLAGADKVFSSWAQSQVGPPAGASQGKTSTSQAQGLDDGAPAAAQTRYIQEPTEVILRGYRSPEQQYAAINHFEQLAGRICEDYPREPPVESRRYKSDLRDPAYTRRQPLTPAERAKVNRSDSGEHWVKVTFESQEAADTAVFASPQSVLGYLIFAEPYHGIPPQRDEPMPDTASLVDDPQATRNPRRKSTVNIAGFAAAMMNPTNADFSPPRSIVSSRTADTATAASSATVSTGTVTGARRPVVGAWTQAATTSGADAAPAYQPQPPMVDQFCRAIPTVRKAKILPAEQAVLPSPGFTQRALNNIPLYSFFSGSLIGNEVPRTDLGEFDWERASLYWKFIWMLDSCFGLFGGDIVTTDKDD
ncbi:hypothetical protein QBC39DRAFT_292738 [Podospora conica]|nr:hypothetical protein QBC39DRAFT_292738 [Schizothecium conicum]